MAVLCADSSTSWCCGDDGEGTATNENKTRVATRGERKKEATSTFLLRPLCAKSCMQQQQL
jgi:hypothetical protein